MIIAVAYDPEARCEHHDERHHDGDHACGSHACGGRECH